MNNRIILQQLAESIALSTNTDKATAEALLREITDLVSSELSAGRRISIPGIGTFARGLSDENPVIWQPEQDMADAVNEPFTAFEPVVLDDALTDDMLAHADEINSNPATDDIDSDQPSAVYNDTPREITSDITPESLDNINAISPAGEKNDDHVTSAADTHTEDSEVSAPTSYTSMENDKDEEQCGNQTADEDGKEDPVAENNIKPEYTDADTDEPVEPSYRLNPLWTFIGGVAVGLVLGCFAGYFRATDHDYSKSSPDIDLSALETAYATTTADSIIVNDTDASMTGDPDSTAAHPDSVVAPAPPVPLITDTVTTRRYLTTMARKYYGNYRFWVYIFEENRDIITDPNRIKPGTVVVIPPADKYGIDASDSASVARASHRIYELTKELER